MHDQPEPTDAEDELASTERQHEEESMRYPGHEAPDEAAEDDSEG